MKVHEMQRDRSNPRTDANVQSPRERPNRRSGWYRLSPATPTAVRGWLPRTRDSFLILAVVAGFLGVAGTAGLSWDIATWLVIVFLVLAITSFVL